MTGQVRERNHHDYYPSPAWTVRRLLEHVDDLPGGRWLEPCAGDGAIIRAVNQIRDDVEWIAWELRPECRDDLEATGAEVVIGDSLEIPAPVDIKVVLTNPPFRLADPMLRRFYRFADELLMLLRIGFCTGSERSHFLRETGPACYVLPNRIDFNADGGTDNSGHAWYHWWPNPYGAEFRILAETSVEERRRDREEMAGRRRSDTPFHETLALPL